MIREIGPEELASRLASGAPTRLVDVRQEWEHEIAALPGSELLPLDALAYGDETLEPRGGEELVVVYCHHGVRSLTGVALIQRQGWTGEIVSLAGGIDAWSLRVDPSVPRY
ncbi:rhodanese-like domain-containing protein [Vulgatibacter sp.]|uniref:rhodanese-like domain-containing protein n=1 Tax=Vulgatibacter sp. TaxID=1971226 RepID=UPI0035617DB3